MWNTSSCILSPANHVKYHKLFCQCLGSVIIHCSPLILLRFDFMPRLVATEKGNYCSSSSSSAQKHLEWDQLSTGATPSQFSCWGAVLGTASAEDRVLIKLPRRAQWWPPPVGWDKQRPAQAHLHTLLLLCSPQSQPGPSQAGTTTTVTCEHQAGILQLFLGNLEAEGLIVEGIYRAPHAGGLLGFR